MPRFAALPVLLLIALPARGQEPDLALRGISLGGARTSLTEGWTVLQVNVANPTGSGRDARVAVLFPEQPGVQYARDVWVPAKAALTTWLPVGPAPKQAGAMGREIQSLLYDRTGGAERLILPPGEERVRARAVVYRPRESTTAVTVDYPADPDDPEYPTRPTSRAAQAVLLTHVARAAVSLPDHAPMLPDGPLAPTPEGFNGIDHFVVAGSRLASDPAGLQALRQWIRQGGRAWVLLDLADPETVAIPLLGDELPFEVVDRVGLTTVRLRRPAEPPTTPGREFEQPVELVRVLTTPADHVFATVDGWPAGFARPVGRGRVVFTTLGARAWFRPRGAPAEGGPPGKGAKGMANDPASPYSNRPHLPVGLPAVETLAAELMARPQPHPFTPEDLRPLLTEEIGYAVPGPGTAAAILGAFLAALVGLGIGLRRSRRPELVGWLAPAAALGAGALFVVLAETSRRSVPPTVATAAVVDVVPGSDEAAVNGLFAVYSPESGPVPLASHRGALLNLDTEGLEGQTRKRIQTDTDAWRYEGLSLPAGVRTGPFQATARTGPVRAVGRFGPTGLEGTLTARALRGPADGLITTAARLPTGVRFGSDGTFAAGVADELPAGQFLAGAVLTDQQQRRQAVYRQLLGSPLPPHLEGRDLLMAWAESTEVPFTGREGSRVAGTALWVVPLELDPTPPGTRVTVPAAFVPYRRVVEDGLRQPTLESTYPIEMRLRFQLPAAVRPLTVERATVRLRIRAPSRRVSISGLAGDQPVPVRAFDSPTEPVEIEIAREDLLRLDDQGGLYLVLAVTNLGEGQLDTPWRIESVGLEVVGRTGER